MTIDANCTVECSLSLSGRNFDEAAVTAALALKPTDIWRQKRPDLAARVDLANLSWNVRVGPSSWTSLDEAVDALLAAVGDAHARVSTSANAFGLKVSVVCVVILYQGNPPSYFVAAKNVRAIADMGAELSVEIFDRRDLDE